MTTLQRQEHNPIAHLTGEDIENLGLDPYLHMNDQHRLSFMIVHRAARGVMRSS